MTTRWSGRRLLVVVAHPDDETFGCGSVIADAAAAGASVAVCCATRGEAGEVRAGVDLGGTSLAEVRVGELHAAGTALGVQTFVELDFEDSGMTGEAAPATLVGAPFEAVAEAVAEVIERFDPDVVVTLDPTGGDGHRDHVRIGEATTEAVQRLAARPSLYYWCVTRSMLVRWLDRLRAANPDAGHLQLDTTNLGRPDDDITTVLDVGDHLAVRRRAIRLHASQQSPYDDMPDDLVHAFLCEDRLVRAEPPWTGGPLESQLLLPTRGGQRPGHQ